MTATNNNRDSTAQYRSGKRLAVVVGANYPAKGYYGLLQWAEDDAKNMAKALERYGNFEVESFLGHKAINKDIRDAIYHITQDYSTEPAIDRTKNDFLLFYFSGHGIPIISSPSKIKDQDEVYLGTADFTASMLEHHPESQLSLPWLRDALFKTSAGCVLIILDCCHSEDVTSSSENDYLKQMEDYFRRQSSIYSGRKLNQSYGGTRLAIAAARYGQYAEERDGHGILTDLIVQVLKGEVKSPNQILDPEDQEGSVTLHHLKGYLEKHTSESFFITDCGTLQGFTIAQHPELAEKIRREQEIQSHPYIQNKPTSYIPYTEDSVFQERRHCEIDELVGQLTDNRLGVPRIGLIGMGGCGKTRLAYEIARCVQNSKHFPDGVFWVSTEYTSSEDNHSQEDWQEIFAQLAVRTRYLPLNDNPASPTNTLQRAVHICHYLAKSSNLLLIYDNVIDPQRALEALSAIAGCEVHCAILYTSRHIDAPYIPYWAHLTLYRVDPLSDEGALKLLLERRPDLLHTVETGEQHEEVQAAHAICQAAQNLPLSLILLRNFLKDPYLTVDYLKERYKRLGMLGVASVDHKAQAMLEEIFILSWKQIEDKQAQRLLQLASYFPSHPIPLRLLGIAANLDEDGLTSINALGAARDYLKKWSLIEVLSREEIYLHPLIRELIQNHIKTREDSGVELCKETALFLVKAFTDLEKLEKHAQEKGYWQCLQQVQLACKYVEALGVTGEQNKLEQVKTWLVSESDLLSNGKRWPKLLPELFYQQLYNHSIMADLQCLHGKPPTRWVCLSQQIGKQHHTPLWRSQYERIVTCIAFSPDGTEVAVALYDPIKGKGSVRIEDIRRLKEPRSTSEIKGKPLSVTFSPDCTKVLAGTNSGHLVTWDTTNCESCNSVDPEVDITSFTSLIFLPDSTLAAIGTESGCIYLCDVENGEVRTSLPCGTKSIISLAISHNKTKIAACSKDQQVYIWDIPSEKLFTFSSISSRHTLVTCLALSPDGETLFIGNDDGSIYVWTLSDGTKQIISASSISAITSIAVSHDNSKIVVGTEGAIGFIRDKKTTAVIAILPHHSRGIINVNFSYDDKNVITVDKGQNAHIWPSISSSQITTEEPKEEITIIMLSSNNSIAVTASADRFIQQWNTQSGQLLKLKNKKLDKDDDSIVCAALCPQDTYIALGTLSGSILLGDLIQSGKLAELGQHTNTTGCIAFSSNGQLLASGSNDQTIYLYNLRNKKRIAASRYQRGRAKCLAFLPNCTKIVICTSDGFISLWEITTGKCLIEKPSKKAPIKHLCISSDGSKFATSPAGIADTDVWLIRDNCILEWLHIPNSTNSPVTTLSFSPDGCLLVVCYNSGYVDFIRLEERTISLLGMFDADSAIKAIHWQDTHHLLLAGVKVAEPHFYHLMLKGNWHF